MPAHGCPEVKPFAFHRVRRLSSSNRYLFLFRLSFLLFGFFSFFSSSYHLMTFFFFFFFGFHLTLLLLLSIHSLDCGHLLVTLQQHDLSSELPMSRFARLLSKKRMSSHSGKKTRETNCGRLFLSLSSQSHCWFLFLGRCVNGCVVCPAHEDREGG